MAESLEKIYVARIMSLEKEITALRDQIEVMRDALGAKIEMPSCLRLTGCEAKLLGFMLKNEIMTKGSALTALYWDRPDADEPEMKIIDVFVCKLRKKLKRFEIEIETIWGRGYLLNEENKQRLRELITAHTAKYLAVVGNPEAVAAL